MKARLPKEYTAKGAGEMMKQAQQMQQNIAAAQQELAARSYTASAGGGMVTATVSGEKALLSLSIKPEVVDPEDVEMLADLIIAAVGEAGRLADEDSESTMSQLTGGLNLPGMF